MRLRFRRSLVHPWAVIMGLCALAHGMPAIAYDLVSTAISNAAISETGGSYGVYATLGQAVVAGPFDGGSYSLALGFWANTKSYTTLDTPRGEMDAEVVNRFQCAAPNPFFGRTTLFYSVSHEARVRLTVLDVAGRRVRTLVSGSRQPGQYRAGWDGRDDGGRLVSPGLYFARLQIDSWAQSLRVLKVR